MKSQNKLLQPVLNNWPIKLGVTLVLVLIVCGILFVSGTWGGLFMDEPLEPAPVTYEPVPEYEPEPEEIPEQTPEPMPEETPEPTPEPILDGVNPLTGMPLESAKERNKPLAISLSNVPEALPMNGVSKADIIYEVPVEGGLTRMLAFYQDFSNVPKAGSIRSARHYTAEIAHSYDAIFITAGGSPQAYSEVRREGITHFDEVGGSRREIFFRDRGRVPGRRFESLHSVVITNERIERWFPEYDIDLIHDRDWDQGLVFVEDGTPEGGRRATEAVVRFSSGKSSTFTYDTATNAYRLRQFNRDFIDANNDVKPDFTNIIVIKTRVTMLGDGTNRRNVVTVGEGEGYYINGGSYIEIEWSRGEKDAPYKYTLKNGSPLELGQGKTFIGIIPNNMSVSFD